MCSMISQLILLFNWSMHSHHIYHILARRPYCKETSGHAVSEKTSFLPIYDYNKLSDLRSKARYDPWDILNNVSHKIYRFQGMKF